MTPTITAGLVISILAIAGTGAGAWSALNSNVTENKTLIQANSSNDKERLENLKEDLKELKENDKETQRLIRELIERVE